MQPWPLTQLTVTAAETTMPSNNNPPVCFTWLFSATAFHHFSYKRSLLKEMEVQLFICPQLHQLGLYVHFQCCRHDVNLLPLCGMTPNPLLFPRMWIVRLAGTDGCTHGWCSVAQPGQRLLVFFSFFSFHFSCPSRNLLPISHVCTEEGEKPMVLLPFMAWGNLKLFLRQCKLAEANNPQVSRAWWCTFRHTPMTHLRIWQPNKTDTSPPTGSLIYSLMKH